MNLLTNTLKRWTKLLSLFFFLFLGTSPYVWAQNAPAGGVWSLENCIDQAIKNNLNVSNNDLQVRIDENNYLQSKIERYPDLNAFANQRLSWGRAVDPFSNDFVNERINSNDFSISSQLTVFNGFSISNTIKQNAIQVESSKKTAEQSRYDVSLDVALAYLNILLNKELLEVAEQNVLSTQQQLDRTQKLFDAGSVAENDVIDLKSTLANNELEVVNAQNRLQISKVNLQQFMNIPIDPSFDIQSVDLDNVTVTDITETAQQVYNNAEATFPSVKSADLDVEASDYGIQIAKADRWPRLTLTGSVFTGFSSATSERMFNTVTQELPIGFLESDPNETVIGVINSTELAGVEDIPFFNQLGDNLRQSVTLAVSIPIFNRWRTKNNISNQIIRKQQAEVQAKNVRLQLRQTIEQAYTDAIAAQKTYKARLTQVEALELSFDITEKRYQAGAANIVDFNLARINRDNARSDAVRAKYDFLFRQKVLDFYMGRELTFD